MYISYEYYDVENEVFSKSISILEDVYYCEHLESCIIVLNKDNDDLILPMSKEDYMSFINKIEKAFIPSAIAIANNSIIILEGKTIVIDNDYFDDDSIYYDKDVDSKDYIYEIANKISCLNTYYIK